MEKTRVKLKADRRQKKSTPDRRKDLTNAEASVLTASNTCRIDI